MRRVDYSVIYDSTLQLWLSIDEDKAYIGLTDWGQTTIGDIQEIIIPKSEEDTIIQNSLLMEIESSKAITEILSPITGIVLSMNENILNNPQLINEQPYMPNWMICMKLSDKSQLEECIASDEYKDSIDAFFRKS